MAAKIKQWFEKMLESMEKAGMERARQHLKQHGYRGWE